MRLPALQAEGLGSGRGWEETLIADGLQAVLGGQRQKDFPENANPTLLDKEPPSTYPSHLLLLSLQKSSDASLK